jgi:hypothetical protein
MSPTPTEVPERSTVTWPAMNANSPGVMRATWLYIPAGGVELGGFR